jgi:hypothetical protein
MPFRGGDALRQGDEDAFGRLVDQYHTSLGRVGALIFLAMLILLAKSSFRVNCFSALRRRVVRPGYSVDGTLESGCASARSRPLFGHAKTKSRPISYLRAGYPGA